MYLWMNQDGWTPLVWAACSESLPVVEYLLARGANIEATDKVRGVLIDMKLHTQLTCTWLQGWTHAIDDFCAGESWFPSGWIFGAERSCYWGERCSKWYHVIDANPCKRHTWTYVSMNVSVWKNSVDVGCNEWSITSGWISGGERRWYRDKGWCTWCHIIDVKSHIRHTWILYVNVSVWIHSIDACCNEWSFTSGGIFDGERSWCGGKG